MPAVATEKWSGKGRGVDINAGDKAVRVFDVIGAASEDAAIADMLRGDQFLLRGVLTDPLLMECV